MGKQAYLAYGIPQNRLKRLNLLQKAAYKVGAYSINAQTIEHSILGCPSNRTAPVKKASSQIQIALQLFASTGKTSYNFMET
jgi:hypothetical protein